MDIQGTVIEVMPILSGVSKQSGREWSSQEFIIEYNQDSQYPRKACLRIFGQERIAEFNIKVGEYVRVSFDVDSSKYMERWYTRLNAFRVLRIDQTAGVAQGPAYGGQQPAPNYGAPYVAPQPAPQAPMPPQPAPAPQAPQAPEATSDAPFNNDLPF